MLKAVKRKLQYGKIILDATHHINDHPLLNVCFKFSDDTKIRSHSRISAETTTKQYCTSIQVNNAK